MNGGPARRLPRPIVLDISSSESASSIAIAYSSITALAQVCSRCSHQQLNLPTSASIVDMGEKVTLIKQLFSFPKVLNVSARQIATCLSIMRRLPPSKIEQNLTGILQYVSSKRISDDLIRRITGLLNLVPEEADEISQRVDQPLQEAYDTDTVRILYALAIFYNLFRGAGSQILVVRLQP
jgi:hypothetical protein